MKYYAVIFVPNDIWISSYENALRFLPITNRVFNKTFSTQQAALEYADATLEFNHSRKRNAIIYTIETNIDPKGHKFSHIDSIDKIEFVYQQTHHDFNRENLLKELKGWIESQEKYYGNSLHSYVEYRGRNEANQLVVCLENTAIPLHQEVREQLESWSKMSNPNVIPLVSIYQKYQFLISDQTHFSFECNKQTRWNQDYFDKTIKFMQAYKRLADATTQLTKEQIGNDPHELYPNDQRLRLSRSLQDFVNLIAHTIVKKDVFDASSHKYYNETRNKLFPQNPYLGVLPTLTQAMNLIASRLNIDENGMICKNGISNEDYKKEVAKLKQKSLMLQSDSADFLEYLSYLMFAISACVAGLTLASVAPPVGFAIAAGCGLAGLGIFKYAESAPERQPVMKMKDISQRLEKYVPSHLWAGH